MCKRPGDSGAAPRTPGALDVHTLIDATSNRGRRSAGSAACRVGPAIRRVGPRPCEPEPVKATEISATRTMTAELARGRLMSRPPEPDYQALSKVGQDRSAEAPACVRGELLIRPDRG